MAVEIARGSATDHPPALAAVLVSLSVLGYVGFIVVFDTPGLTDLRVYRAEGQAVREGLDLYGPLPGVHGVNTYPPLAALLFVPATFVSLEVLKVLSVIGNLILVLVLSWQSVRRVRQDGPGIVAATCVLAAVALWCEPVTGSLSYGQINLLVLALVLWDFSLPAGSHLRGAGVGLAAAIKVTPAILIVYLVLTRRFRAAATAGCTVLATIGVSALVDANATTSFWTGHLFDPGRAGRLENSVNQSVRGWIVRAGQTRDTGPTELLLILVVLLAGMACAIFAQRRLGDAWGLLAAGVTGMLVSPISWSHHWVYCVPILALLWYQARLFAIAALALFLSRAVWAVPHGGEAELHLTGPEVALSGCYVLFGLGFLALTGWRAHRVKGRGYTGPLRPGPGGDCQPEPAARHGQRASW